MINPGEFTYSSVTALTFNLYGKLQNLHLSILPDYKSKSIILDAISLY